MSRYRNLRRHVGSTSSWGVIGLLIATAPGLAYAQAVEEQPAPASSEAVENEQATPEARDGEILVIGTRASQQSAINRKRDARTATDSIVADDIGSFPDRNAAEAVSRLPGVALNRNEFGEGTDVAIRGNNANLTRIELDGVGVQSTHDVSLGADGGRSGSLRELPAELVKSIDVVKGSTADMTEGGLGGSIQIKTRTGLDFSRPYYSLRIGGQRNSLDEQWTPDVTAVATRKFFGDRLGVIVSGTYNGLHNDSHSIENTVSNNRSYARYWDFDNSPEKTFEYNLDTLGTDAASLPFANSFQPGGQAGLTPRMLLERAASAQSKAQCFSLFPHLAATAATAQKQQRAMEQGTCLNQWNDYTPSLIRYLAPSQHEERYAIDARLDFRVNDDLVVYAKGTQANRKANDQFRTFSPGSMPGFGPGGTFVDTPTANANPRTRSLAPGPASAGYYLWDPQFGLNFNNNNSVLGHVLNVVPGTVVVDDAHNVTEFTTTHNFVNVDQISNIIDTKQRYLQAGGEYRRDRLEIDAMVGQATAKTTRFDMRSSRFFEYGDAEWSVQPTGLWNVEPLTPYDLSDMGRFAAVTRPPCVPNGGTDPATCIGRRPFAATAADPNSDPNTYLVSQMPWTSGNFGVQYSPRIGETSEKIAKFDVGYRTDGLLPFITRVKTGGQVRNQVINSWAGGGYTVSGDVGTFGQPGFVSRVVVPTANVRGSFRSCQPTSTSTLPCDYGFVQSTALATPRQGVHTFTPAEMEALLGRHLEERDMIFFDGLPGSDLGPVWTGIDSDALFAELGHAQFMNFDCVIECTANDGKVYAQPVNRIDETVKNIYAMIEFEQDLPLGLLFNGNVGIRGVMTTVKATGMLTLNAIRLVDQNNPTGQTFTQSFSQNVNFHASPKTDWLPTANFNLWAFDETVVLRAYGGRTISRPRPSALVPAGTCTVVEAQIEADTSDPFGCGGRIGNPLLKPFTANSYNLALEWYPNADTLFSVAYGKLDVKVGNPIQVTQERFLFAGSDLNDPVTGIPLADFAFTVPTWENGPGFKRDIFEFSAKSAFTFLPWFLRYTGADANLSIVKSASSSGTRDPQSGDLMLPVDESKYYTNISLWYDDGKLNLRVAYQKRSDRFSCITPCGGNNTDWNYPGEGYTNVNLNNTFGGNPLRGPLGYNPGVARFTDGSVFIDAKASYNITDNIQVYVEGRNVRREAQTDSTGPYQHFSDGTPKIMRSRYAGRRVMAGVTVKFGSPN